MLSTGDKIKVRIKVTFSHGQLDVPVNEMNWRGQDELRVLCCSVAVILLLLIILGWTQLVCVHMEAALQGGRLLATDAVRDKEWLFFSS